MADNEAVIEQLRKDNEDLRRQLGDMTTQLERITTLLTEQHTNTDRAATICTTTIYLTTAYSFSTAGQSGHAIAYLATNFREPAD